VAGGPWPDAPEHHQLGKSLGLGHRPKASGIEPPVERRTRDASEPLELLLGEAGKALDPFELRRRRKDMMFPTVQRHGISMLLGDGDLQARRRVHVHSWRDDGPRCRVVWRRLRRHEEPGRLRLQTAHDGVSLADRKPRVAAGLETEHPGDLFPDGSLVERTGDVGHESTSVFRHRYGDGLVRPVETEREREAIDRCRRHAGSWNE
jgi:hypothetical protein